LYPTCHTPNEEMTCWCRWPLSCHKLVRWRQWCSLSCPTTNHLGRLFNKLCLFHIIILIHVPSITKDQILEVSFDDFKPLQHNNPRSKSSFDHRKKLHVGIVIEYDKPHGMVCDKILHDQGIIRDLRDPTALSIRYNICLRIFSCKNILVQDSKCALNKESKRYEDTYSP